MTEAAAFDTRPPEPGVGRLGLEGRDVGVVDVEVGVVRLGRVVALEGLVGLLAGVVADLVLVVDLVAGADDTRFDVVLVGGGGTTWSWDSNSGVLVSVRCMLSTSLDGVLLVSKDLSSFVGVISPTLTSSSMLIVSPRVKSALCTKLSILLAKYWVDLLGSSLSCSESDFCWPALYSFLFMLGVLDSSDSSVLLMEVRCDTLGSDTLPDSKPSSRIETDPSSISALDLGLKMVLSPVPPLPRLFNSKEPASS